MSSISLFNIILSLFCITTFSSFLRDKIFLVSFKIRRPLLMSRLPSVGLLSPLSFSRSEVVFSYPLLNSSARSDLKFSWFFHDFFPHLDSFGNVFVNSFTGDWTPLIFIFQDDTTFTSLFVPRITMLADSCCYFEAPTGCPTHVGAPTNYPTSIRVFISYFSTLNTSVY